MPSPIEAAELTGKFWIYGHKGGRPTTEFFQFIPDGTISGCDHKYERFWAVEDGVLFLLGDKKERTSRFVKVSGDESKMVLEGPHIPNPKIILTLTELGLEWPKGKTQAALASNIRINGWRIGDHTYGVPIFSSITGSDLTIGKYTSIGEGVRVVFSNHRISNVSTYPFKSFNWPSAPRNSSDHLSKGPIFIGNDVWIGHNVTILSGVRIGDGAVIGANSLIAKDIPAYAITGGNPAKVIRIRFSDAIVSSLIASRWWDWPNIVVDACLGLILSEDINKFVRYAENITDMLKSGSNSTDIISFIRSIK
jgi:virginiamycin A acetyltransferase